MLDVDGMTPKQFADLYALPKIPTHICEVQVPEGFRLETGFANSMPEWGRGGGIQFDTLNVRLSPTAFSKGTEIGGQ